jgi:hypothetical protein
MMLQIRKEFELMIEINDFLAIWPGTPRMKAGQALLEEGGKNDPYFTPPQSVSAVLPA